MKQHSYMKSIKPITLLAAFLLTSMWSVKAQSPNDLALKKLNTFYKYIELAYVDSTNTEKMVEDAIKAVLKDLDPHSVYIPKKDLQRKNEPLVGNFEGVGIQFNILHDTITVVSPISGGPSEKLGIRSGDKIIKIEEKTVAGVGFTNKDVADHLRGKKGTKVKVSIKRRGIPELLEYEITRDKIPIYSVDAVYMAAPKTGYIKLNRFAATTMSEIHSGLDSLNKEGMKNLILDLRGNSGGYLNVAIDLADQFLDKDKLIVYTQGRSYPKSETFSSRYGRFKKGKLIVLIDEGSASASEIVSGAVQDWDRGLIIGRRSFGKGLVQKPFALPDGSGMRLTISRYYTPSGRSIQKPYDKGGEEYYKDVLNRYEHGELMNQDSIQFPDSLKYKTLKVGRTVYGGGGIMPDIFVPLDTTYTSDYWGKLIRKGVLNQFSLDYLDANRAIIASEHKTRDDFASNFTVNESLLEEFVNYAADNGVEKDEEGLERSKLLIQTNLKALIGRGIWKSTAFYQITNQIDPTFKRALDAINDGSFKSSKLSYK